MIARYWAEPRPSGQFRVQLWNAPAVIRPNRQAAGMSYTSARSDFYRRARGLGARKERITEGQDVLRLIVTGTTARPRALHFVTERVPCACCGSKQRGALRLNDRGRLRLRALKQMRKDQPDARYRRDGFGEFSALFYDYP